jgi:hypothetical protein
VRRRHRRGSGRGLPRRVLLVGAVGALSSLLGSGAYTTGSVERDGAADVVADANGPIGVEVFGVTLELFGNDREPLVTVTNGVDQSVDLTVSLGDGGDGTLYFDGQSGNSVTATGVGSGDAVTVEVRPSVIGTLPFTVSAVAPGIEATLDRSTTVGFSFFGTGAATPTLGAGGLADSGVTAAGRPPAPSASLDPEEDDGNGRRGDDTGDGVFVRGLGYDPDDRAFRVGLVEATSDVGLRRVVYGVLDRSTRTVLARRSDPVGDTTYRETAVTVRSDGPVETATVDTLTVLAVDRRGRLLEGTLSVDLDRE